MDRKHEQYLIKGNCVMKSLTAIRNGKIVGNNNKSYNDKHPNNPIVLRPIRDACAATHPNAFKLRAKLRAMANWSRPEIARGIARLMRSI